MRSFCLWAGGLLQLRRRGARRPGRRWRQAWPRGWRCDAEPARGLGAAGAVQPPTMRWPCPRRSPRGARQRVAQVWPVLEVHATLPLLRMLEAEGLLPVRNPQNT
jgi:hypothetical protein